VTFGITPAGPATGYGYIDPGDGDGPVRPVRRFVEKPDRETAMRYVADGWLWNAGIFLFRPDVFLQALRRYAPEVAEAVSRTYAASRQADGIVHIDATEFAQSRSISVDHAVMEHADTVSVAAVSMGWSDVGSWDALWEVSAADADGNRLDGAVSAIDCANSLVRNAGGPFVAALGLEDMVVVATGNAILVAPRSRAEEVKQVVADIEARGLDLARTSHEVRRPWGSYRCLTGAEGWQTKRITVRPGGQLSLQKHAWRAETWVVASGRAIVTVDAETIELDPGESVHIPVGAVHRLENPGPAVLELLEVQLGSYLGEDDIVRLADVYGRVPAA
jgi:mannose-1-phosphate guanylyltransferase / mannose-6-phosphate isomerase